MDLPLIKDARVLQGLQFNCPKCGVQIGELCRSLARSTPMARWIHPHRIPHMPPTGGYREARLREWLKANARILLESQ